MGIAPYQIYLCPLRLENEEIAKAADKVYQELTGQNIEVLYDDRQDSPGVKFNDADLLGIPIRLTLSPRTLQNQSIEIKWRNEEQTELIPLGEIISKITGLIRKAQNS
jgi:prolyl-tRNA synthetase